SLPRKAGTQARAQLKKPDARSDVAWPGGRAGT
ncbi:MAG: hypothetical protein H6Q10_1312, partial [Acidobacteria bacterium]|nr:hypothetical protein [Acidobacteriota bacterium]